MNKQDFNSLSFVKKLSLLKKGTYIGKLVTPQKKVFKLYQVEDFHAVFVLNPNGSPTEKIILLGEEWHGLFKSMEKLVYI